MPGKREKEGEELKSSFNRSVEKIPISLHKKFSLKIFLQNTEQKTFSYKKEKKRRK